MADRSKLAAALLNQTPGYKYGTILPMAYNPTTGDRKLAIPGLLADFVNSPVKMGQMARGERDIDPAEVFEASMDFSPAGLLGRVPAGSLGMNVFQGSPHKYGPEGASQSLKHIGKGEGATAYGWGRYDAGAREVADQYRKNLAYNPDEMKIGGKQINDFYNDIQDRAAKLSNDGAALEYEKAELVEQLMMHDPIDEIAKHAADNMSPQAAKWFNDEVAPNYESFGHLYKHDLPDEDIARYLDWDKPLSEQPEIIAKLMDVPDGMWDDISGLTGEQFYNRLKKDALEEAPEDSILTQLLPDVENYTPEEAASRFLGEARIPGLQYYDGMSRNAGEGTRNYVTWDQDVLDRMKLLERNGETFASKTPPTAGLLSQWEKEKREGLAGLLADGVRRGMAGGVF